MTGKAGLGGACFSLRVLLPAITNPRKLKHAPLKQRARRTVPLLNLR